MTDLVFLLLIFFVILSTMSVNSQEIDLPGKGKFTGKKSEALEVRITKAQVYKVNKSTIARAELEDAMTAAMEKREKKAILLVVDKEVPHGDLVEVLGIATVNDWKINLASTK